MRILSITGPDLSNGIGNRITIWVSGCTHQCPGCHNANAHNYNSGTDISIEDNYNKIYDLIITNLNKPYIKGITLSGGDPLDQSDENTKVLIKLVKQIKNNFPDKDIWIYSGDVFENLIKNPYKRELLKLCDILVDGPFIKEKQKTGLPFRGSDNQRIITLKEHNF